MARLVMKFGGTSVADIDRIRNVARHVKREVDAGHDVAVVVSAMAGATDQLVKWCEAALKTRQLFDAREYDAVVATGEQVTAGLLAIRAPSRLGVDGPCGNALVGATKVQSANTKVFTFRLSTRSSSLR